MSLCVVVVVCIFSVVLHYKILCVSWLVCIDHVFPVLLAQLQSELSLCVFHHLCASCIFCDFSSASVAAVGTVVGAGSAGSGAARERSPGDGGGDDARAGPRQREGAGGGHGGRTARQPRHVKSRRLRQETEKDRPAQWAGKHMDGAEDYLIHYAQSGLKLPDNFREIFQ